MATLAQITANRANAQLSSGPKSPAGKMASAVNATAHGLASSHTVLPHEDPAGFASLLERFTAEFRPEGEHHGFLVRQMADSRWRLERIQRLEGAVFDLMIEAGDADRSPDHRIAAGLMAGSPDALGRLERYRAAAERAYYKAYKTLHDDRYYASTVDAELYAAEKIEKFVERFINAPAPNQPGHPNYDNYRRSQNEANRAPAPAVRVQNEPSLAPAPVACVQNEPNRAPIGFINPSIRKSAPAVQNEPNGSASGIALAAESRPHREPLRLPR